MKIAHASDLHGRYEVLDRVGRDVPDLWALTGDFFPNHTRGDAKVEVPWQTRWFAWKGEEIVSRLRGAPVLIVPGNHDYADLARLLRLVGVDAHEVTTEGVQFRGVKFSGFGHIPFIAGEWNREASQPELHELTRLTLESDPEVILTHSPPNGILNGRYPGISSLTTALAYQKHRVHLHLFGHAHEDGGRFVEHRGIRFVNSATTLRCLYL